MKKDVMFQAFFSKNSKKFLNVRSAFEPKPFFNLTLIGQCSLVI